MAAAALSLSLYLDPRQQHLHTHLNSTKGLPFPSSGNPLLSLHKLDRYNFKCSLPSSSSTNSVTSAQYYSFLDDPFRGSRFLTNEELEKLKALESFVYLQELESGSLWVRAMRAEEMDLTVGLLAESFAESMLMPLGYEALLRFLVKQYLIERRAVMPHAVTLVGFYRENGQRGEELAGTVEVCFDKRGANSSPPSPTPPKNSPYICNMTVTKQLRRRGIGWHLLKASEELISQMTSSKEVYLHCRMIDEAPFNMYIKAGYNVLQTDSIFILLTLQRRKHLMRKKLPVFNNLAESDISDSGSLFACIRRLETGASHLHNTLSRKPDLDGPVCSRYQLLHGTPVLLQLL
ncbi:Acyl-CoA N-acyltransferases superfamily protein isoform 2 [Theobroma cacao]|uniref:Acyl-CoA N-acyltransferases superfamily protein isoform 2 n=1 Tax=Theobroma cacao TaxID=3641 RepID=A0A061E716_THECC|nr:Acyl-CoA N-acyltransferases superfamily protein isoform 2 [Theobroma cacao]